jgi:hypothetical protein
MPKDFFLIGGQSNVGTSEKPVTTHSNLGYLASSGMPAELTGTQLNVKVWNGSSFESFAPKAGKKYGWINHFLYTVGQSGKEISFFHYGKGGTQLNKFGDQPPIARRPLEKNGLLAWNHFKANNADARLIFLWCQGFSDGLNEQNSLEYGAHEETNRNHEAGGVLGKWFNRIRKIFNEPNMPVIYNTVSNNAVGSTYRANMKAGQLYVGTLSENNIVVDADGLTFIDSAHFNAQGVSDLADRYVTAYNTI